MAGTAGVFLIIGSVVFGVGASLGVPRVFTTSDTSARRRLLEQHPTAWRAAQPFYAAGPAVAAVGVGLLAVDEPDDLATLLFVCGAVLGWVVIGADLAFLVLYALTRDIPPFVFYLLLAMVGVVVLVET
jgi:hypothetical protein